MKRIEFLNTLKWFSAQNRVGTYFVNEHKEPMYKWKNCVFYFDGKGKVYCIGDIPLDLQYRIYYRFGESTGMTFENGDRGEWSSKNIEVDHLTVEGQNFIKSNYHRIFTFTDMKKLLKFVYFLDNYECEMGSRVMYIDTNRQHEDIERTNEEFTLQEIEEIYETLMSASTYDIVEGLNEMPRTPKVKDFPRFATIKESMISENLFAELDYFSHTINPFHSFKLLPADFSSYRDLVDIDVDILGTRKKMTLKSDITTTYETDGKSVYYDVVYQVAENDNYRIIRRISKYVPGNHSTGDVVAVIRSISSEASEFTRRSIFYNINENSYFDGTAWKRPSLEEVAELNEIIKYASQKVWNSVTKQIVLTKPLKLTPVTPLN